MNSESLLADGVPLELVLALAEVHAYTSELHDVDGAAITVRSEALATIPVTETKSA